MELTENVVLNYLNGGHYPTDDMSSKEKAIHMRQIAALNDYSMTKGKEGLGKIMLIAKEMAQLSPRFGMENYVVIMASLADDHPHPHNDKDVIFQMAVEHFEQLPELNEDMMMSMEQMVNLHQNEPSKILMHYSPDFMHDPKAALEDRQNKVNLYLDSLSVDSSQAPKPSQNKLG